MMKKVNGVDVELTAEEEAAMLAEWEANSQPPTAEQIEAQVQRVADDLTANSDRDVAIAFATIDLAMAVRDGQADGLTRQQLRGLFRDRVVAYLRERI